VPAKATGGVEAAGKFSMATAFEVKEKNRHSWEMLLICVLMFYISGNALRCRNHFAQL